MSLNVSWGPSRTVDLAGDSASDVTTAEDESCRSRPLVGSGDVARHPCPDDGDRDEPKRVLLAEEELYLAEIHEHEHDEEEHDIASDEICRGHQHDERGHSDTDGADIVQV